MIPLKTSTFYGKPRKNAVKIKQILSIFLIFIVILNIIYYLNSFSYSNYEVTILENNSENDININYSGDIDYLFQDPFKKNFEKIWQFFSSKYKSDLDLQIDTYCREGNSDGTIIDDRVYAIDNLLLYKSLLKDQTDPVETYNNYLKLKNSLLWYSGDITQYKYGFVKSVNSTNKEIYDDNRYLIDNLMPIFLLIENIGEKTQDVNYIPSLEEIFYLINSTEFWDDKEGGFYHHNSTTDKYTESNFYGILATLKIHNLCEKLGVKEELMNRAYEMANITMKKLLLNVWDGGNGGFKYHSKEDWTILGDYKYLHVNALGIITLIEYWKETGMINETYFQLAKYLFNKLEVMWNSTHKAYEYGRSVFWDLPVAISDPRKIDLEANSIMLMACLKLFETTGNITYYNRAWQLHDTFENDFYDGSVNAYKLSIDPPVNTNKNFYANLKLTGAYLYAFEIYNSTIIRTSYNVSEATPDYIFNQDTMNITSIYAFKKDIEYYNTTIKDYTFNTTEYKISPADISYLIKFSNGTLLKKRHQQIIDKSITLLYKINDTMPMRKNYFLYIYANSSIFGTAITLRHFNVISGLKSVGILGLPKTLYQGPTLNITVQVNNTRREDVTLNASLEGSDIFNETQEIFLPSMDITNISFHLTAILEADLGEHNITFKLKKNNILYLKIVETINIGHSFYYTDFFYESRETNGGYIDVSLRLKNFLPNSSQYLNITFSGEHLTQEIIDEIYLSKGEARTIYYALPLIDNILSNTSEIEMNIKKGNTTFYSKSFSILIVEKLEIISVTFPEVIPQGEHAYFIIFIQNNQDISELFSLYVNGEKVETNINGLGPGENKIIAKVLPTLNPYDFSPKTYTFVLRDSSDDIIAQYYFKVKIELTPFNLVIFYVLPIIIPIAIVLFYKNKELRHKLLRR